jgi:hypothetical protein
MFLSYGRVVSHPETNNNGFWEISGPGKRWPPCNACEAKRSNKESAVPHSIRTTAITGSSTALCPLGVNLWGSSTKK